MKTETHKANITIKAESLSALVEALDRIAVAANMQIVQNATVSTSIAIEADDISDLITALGDVAGAVARSDGVEASIKAPATAWDGRRIDLTPMEKMINRAVGAGDENLFED